MKNIVTLVVFSVLAFGCNNSKKTEFYTTQKEITSNNHPGKKLMETNCYVCHSPSANEKERIAPPMIAIKKHYINANTTKEQFIANMQSWIKNPNMADAKMFGAVKRFGVMPKAPYPEETIKQIADYMFDNEIEQPDWFEDHYNNEKGNRKGKGQGQGMMNGNKNQQKALKNLPYSDRGLKYALTTKAVLGKNLMGTIQKKGVLQAISFCNENAYPLTDSMSVIHNATIKRVTDKPRNPNNQANKKELSYIDLFKKDIKNNLEPKPIVDEIDNEVHVYYPITTNAMCLQCHGKPNQDIQKSTFSRITNLYPKDKAVGYNINEVRGIWSITFDK